MLDTPSMLGAMLESLMKAVFGSRHDRELKRVLPIVDEVNRLFEEYRDLSDDDLRGKTAQFRGRLAEALKEVTEEAERKRIERETLDDLLPEAFAAVKETCRRLCGKSWDVVGI